MVPPFGETLYIYIYFSSFSVSETPSVLSFYIEALFSLSEDELGLKGNGATRVCLITSCNPQCQSP